MTDVHVHLLVDMGTHVRSVTGGNSAVVWLLSVEDRAGVKYVLSNTNTNTNTFFPEFQIQIQIHRQKSDQIQIQLIKYKYTMRPRQNCRHFIDDISKFIVL